jgi:hypothetical protein
MNYSYINTDNGYQFMYNNKTIEQLLPYVPDVEPRVVDFLRTLYFYKKEGVTPCIPLYMEYQIKKEDWTAIVYYYDRYNIKI